MCQKDGTMDNSNELVETIIDLIKSKKEGVYWDFKEMPYNDNADLLLDILCMANCSHIGDRYLIIGVSDSGKGCEVVGLDVDQRGRKKKAQLINTLINEKFAGDIRPEIDLETISIDCKEIDVIIIKDRPYKPYMLSEDKEFRRGNTIEKKKAKDDIIRAGVVFTRIQDSQTPRNRTADLIHIEQMWKQRYGLDLAPFDRFLFLLSKPNEWDGYLSYDKRLYHTLYPEFEIELIDEIVQNDEICQYYPEETTIYGSLKFVYKKVSLNDFMCLYFSGEEVLVLLPMINRFSRYPKVSFFSSIHEFGRKELNEYLFQISYMSYSEVLFRTPILIFEDILQLREFNKQVRKNMELILNYNFEEEVVTDDFEILDSSHPKYEDQINMFKIKRFYDDWKVFNNT